MFHLFSTVILIEFFFVYCQLGQWGRLSSYVVTVHVSGRPRNLPGGGGGGGWRAKLTAPDGGHLFLPVLTGWGPGTLPGSATESQISAGLKYQPPAFGSMNGCKINVFTSNKCLKLLKYKVNRYINIYLLMNLFTINQFTINQFIFIFLALLLFIRQIFI